jgi:hypothetical protein
MDKLEQWQALLPLKDQAFKVARYGHPRGPETDHIGSRALVDIVEAFPEMLAEIESLRRKERRCARCGGLGGTHTVRGCAALDG